jgi:Cu+-exporting ATPase
MYTARAVTAARPTLPLRPCPACGTRLEPLRAGAVLALDDGYRFLCDEACRERFRRGERSHDRAARAAHDPADDAHRPALSGSPRSAPLRFGEPGSTATLRREEPHVPGRVHFDADASTATGRLFARPALTAVPPPWFGLGTAGLAALLGLLGLHPLVAALSVLATWSATIAALVRSYPARRETGVFAWALGPAGAALAAFAALIGALGPAPTRTPLVGAAIAAGAMVVRAWLDAWARRPVAEAVEALRATLPARLHIPTGDDGALTRAGAQRVVEADSVRTGEDVLALEGEVVAVDGVVKAGEALALLHPGARVPVRRGPGDPLLAGARIVEGAVRLLATRVGADRGLVRPSRFGSGTERDAAPIARAAEFVTRWGGALAILFAASGLVLAEGGGFTAQLGAAAAVLLAAPLLSVRRAAETPLVAAAAIAGARGIVYQSARALDRAGRVAYAALCGHGTITDGRPEVVELHALDGSNGNALISLAAAAESAAEPHAIARAVQRLAERRSVPRESVRRATHLPGRGVTAVAPGGESLVLGSRQLLLDEGVSVAVADAEAARAETRGRTAIFLGLGGRVRAVLSLEDELRPGARAAVQRLVDLGIEVVLLSGDHRGTVETLARGLGIDHIKAQLVPEERGAEVKRLRESGGAVAAVGRPLHDDAALAAADVPVVLGAAGGPAGERAVALVTEDVRDAAAALWIARAARQAAWRDAGLAALGGLTLVGLGATGVLVPGVVAVATLALDAWALPTGARLLRRVALRLPERA